MSDVSKLVNKELHFSEADVKALVDYLNLVAVKATFTMNTQDTINHYKLLNHIQTQILKKMEANILELGDVEASGNNGYNR